VRAGEVAQAGNTLRCGVVARAEFILHESSYPALRRLRCELTDGVSILRGAVPLYYLKQIAQMLVAKVQNEIQISNEIEVTD
jgi:hypothetical protein